MQMPDYPGKSRKSEQLVGWILDVKARIRQSEAAELDNRRSRGTTRRGKERTC